MNYSDYTSKICGFPTSRWEDKVTALRSEVLRHSRRPFWEGVQEWTNSGNYLAPHRGRARYCNAHVCLFVCVCVCVCVCPCFRKISKCNISVISQPIIMKFDMHIPVWECPNPPGGAAGEVCHLWLPCFHCLWSVLLEMIMTYLFTIIFNNLLRNIQIYFQNVWLFLYLGQSRWEDKVTATKIRGSSTLTKTLLKGSSWVD